MININTKGLQSFAKNQNSSSMDPITAGLALGTNVANMFMQGRENKKNRQFQMDENQKARDFNLSMWEKNNAYNTPEAQMMRLKEAGINPHLAYSNGSPMNTSNAPASSNASAMPQGIAPQINTNELLMAMRQEAEINLINAQADTERAKTEGQFLINGLTQKDLDSYDSKLDLDLLLKRTQIGVNEQNIEQSKSEVRRIEQEIINKITENRMLNEKINQIIAETGLTNEQVKLTIQLLAVEKAKELQIQADTRLTEEKRITEGVYRSNVAMDTLNKGELYKQNKVISQFLPVKSKQEEDIRRETLRQAKQVTEKGELDKDWYPIEKGIDLFGQALGEVTNAINLKSIIRGKDVPELSGTTRTVEHYDGRGRRTGKTVESNNRTYKTRRIK